MLVEMRRVDIVAPRRRALNLLRALHRAGVVHLLPFEPPPGTSEAVFGAYPASAATPYDGLLERIAELSGLLGPASPPTSFVAELWELDDAALAARVSRLDPVRARAHELAAERVRLDGELARLGGYLGLIEGLQGVVGQLPALRGYASTAVVVQARYRPLVGVLRGELEELTDGRCELIAADLAGERVAAVLLYPRRLTDEVRALLGGRDLEEVTLPEELSGLPFAELEPRLERERERVRQRLAAVGGRLVELGLAHGREIAALELVLRDRVAEAAALRGAGASEHLVVVCGWVPVPRLAALREALAREVGPEALVVERPLDPALAATAPVAFEHRRLLSAFEPLASFVSLPRYGSLDPTPFLAVSFPVFVGLMVGDIGYGLILLAGLLWARRRWPRWPAWSTVGPVATLAAASTIVFGLLYGEIFGDAGERLLGLRPLWFDRREGAIAFLGLAIAIGAAQVGLGLVLGLVNALLLRDRHELVGRAALLGGLLALLVLLGWIAGPLPLVAAHVAAAVLAVALAVLLVTLGLAGPLELLGAVGNILSYARLMAIGLASVMLAVVANRLGGLTGNLLVGAVVAILLHALNLALGFFDSSIQGLRLHYVEFFTKFVEPGGVRFEPFASALQPGEARLRPQSIGGP